MLQKPEVAEQIRTVIVDDEALARLGLQKRLASFPSIHVSHVCHQAIDALRIIQEYSPDVIFLDIEMPGMSGIELLQELKQQNTPLPYVVFTTAYQDFALQAFDFEPCDYLLKPIEQQRLNLCVDRLKHYLETQALAKQTQELDALLSRRTGNSLSGFIQNLEESQQGQLADLHNLVSFKVGTEWIKVSLHDIYWVEAAGDYMCLHLKDKQHIIRKTMKQLERELNPKMFPRINRSAIVNIHKVNKLTPNSNGEYHAHLSSGVQVKVSRKYKFKLDALRQQTTLY